MKFLVSLILFFGISNFAVAQAIDYPIVAVKAPRKGDVQNTSWQEVFDPINGEAGSDLVIIKPDGTEEILVDAGDNGCVLDPCPF